MSAAALLALMVVTVLTAACVTPVGVRRAAHRELTASALSTDEPSAFSTRVLLREGLLATFDDDAPRAIATLHKRYVDLYETGSPLQENLLFALAEASFLYAGVSGDRAYFLAAALYAYAFLFPDDGSPAWAYPGAYGPFDPRMRIAADLYNRALAEGLSSGSAEAEAESTPGAERKPREALLVPGKHVLPAGEFDLEVDPSGFTWAGYTLEQFVPSANLQVRGLRNRYRQPGLGAPLAASLRDSNPFVKTLASLPIAGDVKAHLIIAVKGNGPPAKGTDGVVPYWSAHIDGLESEVIVRSERSVQSNPHAIEEVRRILLEHAGDRSVAPD